MADTRPLDVTLFRSLTDTHGGRATLTWSELTAALSRPVVCPSKTDAPGWSPAHFTDDERSLPHVEVVALLVFDVDGPLPALPPDLAWFAHTTHSHTPDEPRWRLLVLTDRPWHPSEHPAVWEGAARMLGVPADPSTRDPSRFYWGPSCKALESFMTRCGGAEPLVIAELSQHIEITGVLQPAVFPGEAKSVPGTPENTPGGGGPENSRIFLPQANLSNEMGVRGPPQAPAPIDLEAYVARAKALRNAKTREKLLALLQFGSLPQRGGRNAWMHSAFAAIGALAWPEAVAQYLADGFGRRLELDRGETAEAWAALAMFSYRRALEQRQVRDAAVTTFAKVLGTVEQTDWRHRLITRQNRDGEAQVDANGFNLSLILQNDPAFESLRWNVLTNDIELPHGPLSGIPRGTLDSAVTDWLLATPEYRLKLSREEVITRVMAVARSRPYDAIRDYLEGLRWDGTTRINDLLRVYAKVAYGQAPHVQRISRRFLVGAVARALRPGCQMDSVLLLHGNQGLGKTSFVRALGGPWHAELHLDPTGKDTVQTISGRWFLELSEMVSTRKTDVESLRAFLTRKVDVARLPYQRVTEEFPRRCVFVGTTNEQAVLTDPAGNRRWWPVTVGKIDVHALERDRDQLFAEAVQAFKAGERWWLDATEQHEADEEASVYTEVDDWAELILDWALKHREVSVVTFRDIAMNVLFLDPSQMTRSTRMRIGHALRRLRFEQDGLKGGSMAYKIPLDLSRFTTMVTQNEPQHQEQADDDERRRDEASA